MPECLSVIGYVRCSLQEQVAEGFTLQAQQQRIQQWCELSGVTLEEIVEDPGISGTTPLHERPGGSRISSLLDLRKPAVDAVVVVRLDRLARNAAETLLYLRRFSKGSVGLVSITDRLDLSTPAGRAMANVTAIFGELERDLIAERTSDALSALRRDGRVYCPPPYGWEPVKGRLRQVPEEQKVLKRIRLLRSRGLSYQAIADRLNKQGCPSKRSSIWYGMSIRSVLNTSQKLQEVGV